MGEVHEPLRSLFRRLASGREKWPLYLHGEPGRGKTCAALALLDYISHDPGGPGGCYRTAEQLVDELLAKKFDQRWISRVGLAILDELGEREKNTDLPYTAVKTFADLRGTKPTIYISNLLPAEIEMAYDGRIGSRILCGTWFELTGVDRRMI